MLPCPHLSACPGCPRFMAPEISSAARLTLESLAERLGGTALAVHAGPRAEFRQRARLAVRGGSGNAQIGIFREGTHHVVDIPDCVIHHPLVNQCARALRTAIRETGTSVYSDRSAQGSVRYLQVVVHRPSQTAQVTVVTNDAAIESVAPLFRALEAALYGRLHSLFWNRKSGSGNAILGDRFERWSGPDALEETIGGACVFFPPGAFGQSNLDLAETIVERIHGMVPSGARIAEYYAGVGTIGLGLARQSESLAVNEIGVGSLRGLELGVATLAPDVGAKVTVFPGAAGEQTTLLAKADVAIVDPPRKGLDAKLLGALASASLRDVVYLSCGLGSFERDALALGEAGYRLAELHAYDLFPHTKHVETLARFRR